MCPDSGPRPYQSVQSEQESQGPVGFEVVPLPQVGQAQVLVPFTFSAVQVLLLAVVLSMPSSSHGPRTEVKFESCDVRHRI